MNLNIQVFLDALLNNADFRQYCLNMFYQARGDIISFTENPNCSCKKRLIEYISHNVPSNQIDQLLNDWDEKISGLNLKKNINNNEESTNNVLTNGNTNEFFKAEQSNNPDVTITSYKINEIKEPKIMIGHIVEIPADPLSYRSFIEMTKVEQWVYRGLTILEKEKENKQKVWLIFLF